MSTETNSTLNKKLLIIAHCPTSNTQAMGNALLYGAKNSEIENVDVILKSPFDTHADDVLSSDAIILFTTENFGYMSGALKDFFDRNYYPCLAEPKRNDAKPFALIIKAGLDGTGTDLAVHKIIKGLKWREVHKTLICKGEYTDSFTEQCSELALTIAAQLDNNLI